MAMLLQVRWYGKSDARVRMPSVIARWCSVQHGTLHLTCWPSIAHRDHNAAADSTLDMHFRALGYNHVPYVLRTAAGVADARANAARRVSGGTYSRRRACDATDHGRARTRTACDLVD